MYKYLTDENIDTIAKAWDLYSIQDGGQISRNDLKSAVRECVEKYIAGAENDV